MADQRPTHVYLGLMPHCECVVASCLDQHDTKRNCASTARMVADMITGGLVVERVTMEAAKTRPMVNCQHNIEPSGQVRLL